MNKSQLVWCLLGYLSKSVHCYVRYPMFDWWRANAFNLSRLRVFFQLKCNSPSKIKAGYVARGWSKIFQTHVISDESMITNIQCSGLVRALWWRLVRISYIFFLKLCHCKSGTFWDATMKMRSDSCLEKSNPEKIWTRQFDKLANDPFD